MFPAHALPLLQKRQKGNSYCRSNGHTENNLQENRKTKAKLPFPRAAPSDVDRESQKFREVKEKLKLPPGLAPVISCNVFLTMTEGLLLEAMRKFSALVATNKTSLSGPGIE